jgi:hypothetical protein
MKSILFSLACFYLFFSLSGCSSINLYSPDIEKREFNRLSTKIEQSIQKEIELKESIKSKSGQLFNVELVGVSCADVAKVIYGTILNVPYVINANVYDDNSKIDIVIKSKISHQQLLDVTKRALNGSGIEVQDIEGCLFISRPKESIDGKSSVKKDEVKIISIHELKNVKPEIIDKRLKEVLGGEYEGFKIYSEIGNDLLFYTATQKDHKKIKKIISDFDIPQKQIYLEILIFENSRESVLNNGFTGYLGKVINGVTYKLIPFAGVADVSQFSIIDDPDIFNLIFGILQKENLLYKIASPSLVVKSGHEATLSIGDKIPVLGSTVINNGQTEQNIIYQSTGINIRTKADIIGSNVNLDITLDISAGEINQLSNINSPTISSRSIQSSIICPNSKAVLIGGIYSKKSISKNAGFPSRLKWVKDYLNNNDRSKQEIELLIYIKPVIIADNENLLQKNKI